MIRGIFVGLSTVDLVYEVDEFPFPDTKVTARKQTAYAGGPATNAAITFRHLGGEAALVTSVGRHPMTALVREELDIYGIQLLDVTPERAEAPAVSAVAVNPAGQRNVISANAVGIRGGCDRVNPDVLDAGSILLVDGHLMSTCIAWAQAAGDRGVPVMLDGGSWKPGTERLLPHIQTAICSSDFQPPGCSGADDVLEFLQDQGIRQIAITAGSCPIRFIFGQESGCIPVPQVPAVDTMGAGDIFHGACSYSMAAGLSFVEALTRAASVASHSCRFRGTRAWMEQ